VTFVTRCATVLPVGADSLTAQRRRVSVAWDSYVHGPPRQRGNPSVRPEVADSWDRSRQHLRQPAPAAPLDDETSVQRAWATSPVRHALASVADDVNDLAVDGDLVAAVSDADGRILWTAGGTYMRDRAATVNFVPGGRWDEASIGTNALDLALRHGRSAQVFSAEHYSPCVHGWVCYAAPVTDPATGEVLGVLDFSTTWDRSHPMAMAAVTAFARTLSRALRRLPPQPTRAGRSHDPFVLRVLGHPQLEQCGVPLMASQRQSEILLALALHPEGLTLQQLHAHVYGDAPVSLSTLKAEVSRLRRAVGGALESRPYRLAVPVRVDALEVLELVARGDTCGAVRAWTAELLPDSESPVAVELRLRVRHALRELVLARRDADAAALLAERDPDDLTVVEHALALLPPASPRRALLEARRWAVLHA
jgi:hypothetical protein